MVGHRKSKPSDAGAALWQAARAASKQLRAAGIPHQLIGGLALAAHGYVRATHDVDFLVGAEALIQHRGGLVTLHPAVPIAIGDIPIDSIPTPNESLLNESTSKVEGVPVAHAGLLVFMKLRAGRRKDVQDVRELVDAGIHVGSVRDFLFAICVDDDILTQFENIVQDADRR